MRESLRDFPKTLKRESSFHCIVTNTGWKASSIVFETFHVAEVLLLTAFLSRDVQMSVERWKSGASPGDAGIVLKEGLWNPGL